MMPPDVSTLTEAMNAEYAALVTDAERWRASQARSTALDAAMTETLARLESLLAALPAEPLDYRRCPRTECGSHRTTWRFGLGQQEHHAAGLQEIRYCTTCQQLYRVEFRAVRVEAE